jgi:hypothetical protein
MGGDTVKMNIRLRSVTNIKVTVFLLTLICLTALGSQSVARAGASQWKFGLGTGLFGLNLDGTQGLHLIQINTPVEFDVDLSASDVRDIIDTALGFGGYATNGTWLIDYSIQYLKLEDGESYSGGPLSRFDLEFESSGLEIMVGYPVLKRPNLLVRVHGGIRYTSHEMTSSLVYNGITYPRDLDHDWVDGVIGVSAQVPLGRTVSWDSRLNAGYGGSEGTYQALTGLTWRFHKNWSTNIFGKYTAVEFENGTRGNADWYLYDVDEYGLGLGILFHF